MAMVDARERAGLGTRELARKANVSPAHVCGIERGVRQPSHDVLRRILDALPPSEALQTALDGMLDRDTERWLRASPEAVRLLRALRAADASEELLSALRAQVQP